MQCNAAQIPKLMAAFAPFITMLGGALVSALTSLATKIGPYIAGLILGLGGRAPGAQ